MLCKGQSLRGSLPTLIATCSAISIYLAAEMASSGLQVQALLVCNAANAVPLPKPTRKPNTSPKSGIVPRVGGCADGHAARWGEMLPCVGLRCRLCNGEGQWRLDLLEETSSSLHQPYPSSDEQQTITGCPWEWLQV